jgi:hypothetical protein
MADVLIDVDFATARFFGIFRVVAEESAPHLNGSALPGTEAENRIAANCTVGKGNRGAIGGVVFAGSGLYPAGVPFDGTSTGGDDSLQLGKQSRAFAACDRSIT